MGQPVRVTKQFSEDFARVAAHYACPDSEIAAMKQAARADMENAAISFRAMAQEIEMEIAA